MLKTEAVRDITNSETNYPEIIWLNDIPSLPLCKSITQQGFNSDSDFFIKIVKPSEPEHPLFPKIAGALQQWINPESLTTIDKNPVLWQSIDINQETIHLTDHADLNKLLVEYIENQWPKDFEVYDKAIQAYKLILEVYEEVNKIYKALFKIYNKSQQFGEEYELVVGLGLMQFKENSDSARICRHIITAPAQITFNSKSGSSLEVELIPDKTIQIETDAILDLTDLFDPNDIVGAENALEVYFEDKEIFGNIFDEQIQESIQLFADRIHPEGSFRNELQRPREFPVKPTIYYAPALMLRKRNTQSLSAVYKKILENIKSADDDLVLDPFEGIINKPSSGSFEGENQNVKNFDIETIYFPKKYNDEQIEIIHKSQRNNKVLVQGPPGTGKSHTIANLICHLLANGKRILVTAYSKRALEVLKSKLPDEFQNLAVNLLSGEASSIKDLESSVNAINAKLAQTNLYTEKIAIENLEAALVQTRTEQSLSKNEWLKIREKSVRKLELNKNYQGTLLEIAEKLEKDKDKFTWYCDSFYDFGNTNLIAETKELNHQRKEYLKIDTSVLEKKLPSPTELISPEDFRSYCNACLEIEILAGNFGTYQDVECQDFSKLKTYLSELSENAVALEKNTLGFKEEIIIDSRVGDGKWHSKLSETTELLAKLEDKNIKDHDRNNEISYPATKTLKQLRNDAVSLKGILAGGKKITGILSVFNMPFTGKDIKEKKYFIDGVRVNGSPCDTLDEFNLVLEDLDIQLKLERLGQIWPQVSNIESPVYVDRLFSFSQLRLQVEGVLLTLEKSKGSQKRVENCSSIRLESLTSISLNREIVRADLSSLKKQKNAYEIKISQDNKLIADQNVHPICVKLIEAHTLLDSDFYEKTFKEVTKQYKAYVAYKEFKQIKTKTSQYLPLLVQQIFDNEVSSELLDALEDAFLYRGAFTEVTSLLDSDKEEKLIQELAYFEGRKEKLISQLGSKKAWLQIIEKLDSNRTLRQNLEAWVQAVKKIGVTGKGKKALKFRKVAQEQMELCKNAIPCWIMPLYKVAETISPEAGMYDYVIIDEASQLGPEALFLLYISKNIIIVGDDQQISQENVGINADVMSPHIKKHLSDIPFSDFYGTGFSFFDHAKRFCEGMIVLREHFRCMPEIIEFCNKHFYAPKGKGLIPLRQYNEKRLEPLVSKYCQDGYVEGSESNIINRNEAVSIVEHIKGLIQDNKYTGKTIGVICLQGNKQAALIETLLLQKIGEVEFHNRKIVCGNSASFQGDERDIIFLSLVTASNHKRASLTTPEADRRFNVAMSRAKDQIWLFHSILLDDLGNTNDLRYKMLDHFQNYRPKTVTLDKTIKRTMGSQPEPFDSWFEVDVFNDILNKGFSVIPQHKVGKFSIDLVAILSDGSKIAIECDGDKFHGPEQFTNDMMRQKVLERAGWQFVRIRGGEYYVDHNKAMEPLWAKLRPENELVEQD